MSEIQRMYEAMRDCPSDINEHLPVLREYASRCETIAELGVRNVVSTWAFLSSGAKRVYSFDISELPEVSACRRICEKEGQHWQFRLEDTLTAVLPEDVDMLFVDTLHNYAQVKGELGRHAGRVRKYIGFHDTFTYRDVGMDGGEGIDKAIREFMKKNSAWRKVYESAANNGVVILEKRERKVSFSLRNLLKSIG